MRGWKFQKVCNFYVYCKLESKYKKSSKFDEVMVQNQKKKLCRVSARRLSIHKTYNMF
jgi:hypothetical protein